MNVIVFELISGATIIGETNSPGHHEDGPENLMVKDPMIWLPDGGNGKPVIYPTVMTSMSQDVVEVTYYTAAISAYIEAPEIIKSSYESAAASLRGKIIKPKTILTGPSGAPLHN